MILETFFSTPTSTDFITSAATWAGPLLIAFIAVAAIVVGIFIAGAAVGRLAGGVKGAFRSAIGGRRGGRRRRR